MSISLLACNSPASANIRVATYYLYIVDATSSPPTSWDVDSLTAVIREQPPCLQPRERELSTGIQRSRFLDPVFSIRAGHHTAEPRPPVPARTPPPPVISCRVGYKAQPARKLASEAALSDAYELGGGSAFKLFLSLLQAQHVHVLVGRRGMSGDMKGDHNYRGNAAEPWFPERSASGTWDESSLNTDFSSLDPQSQLNLRQTRQCQSYAGPFPTLWTDFASKPLGIGYLTQPSSYLLPTFGYNFLSPYFVADDPNAVYSRQPAPPAIPIPPQVSNAQVRSAPSLPLQPYPTAKYVFYPNLGRDTFGKYPYIGPCGSPDPSVCGSGGVYNPLPVYSGVPQNLHPNTLDIRQQQLPMYLDYHAAMRPPFQFCFPTQNKVEMQEIAGSIVEFSGDQLGSRFIQDTLPEASNEEKQSVFDEIYPNHTITLIQNVLGNYVIQKLFQHGTQTQKTALVKSMEGHVVYLSCNLYGCRVIQMVCIRFYYEPAKRFFLSLRAWKAIQSILPEQQASFVRELEPHIISCIKDSNGSHVLIRKMFSVWRSWRQLRQAPPTSAITPEHRLAVDNQSVAPTSPPPAAPQAGAKLERKGSGPSRNRHRAVRARVSRLRLAAPDALFVLRTSVNDREAIAEGCATIVSDRLKATHAQDTRNITSFRRAHEAGTDKREHSVSSRRMNVRLDMQPKADRPEGQGTRDKGKC
ncbi:hypothetical protein DFH08DRAFT_821849 [Mycena albidolilacea]|uniref:PUM-HD domain-containing protein n=1 Tax=Mycena albidolilacea TaxID=1033008 RepID=A0AAD6ZAA7_9AGAR|nr:hypothetical protein DFH08DRAFT_821849 [Mycena albidolilacea]